jgi:hypothetical protein
VSQKKHSSGANENVNQAKTAGRVRAKKEELETTPFSATSKVVPFYSCLPLCSLVACHPNRFALSN